MTSVIEAPTLVRAPGPSAWRWWLLVIAAAPATLVGLFRGLSGELPAAYAGCAVLVALFMALARRKSASDPLADSVATVQAFYALTGAAVLAFAGALVVEDLRLDVVAVLLLIGGIAARLGQAGRLGWIGAAGALAYPPLHSDLIGPHIEGFTSWTVWAVDRFDTSLGLAERVGTTSNFLVRHEGVANTLNVAISCSGANGLAATALFSLAVAALSSASLGRRLAWVAASLAVQWVLNVIRILVLFWITEQWGVRVAIDIVHPVIGLALFIAGAVAMWRVARRVGIAPSGIAQVSTHVPRAVLLAAVVGLAVNLIAFASLIEPIDTGMTDLQGQSVVR
jgi:exosortase/archaeosortase family protein